MARSYLQRMTSEAESMRLSCRMDRNVCLAEAAVWASVVAIALWMAVYKTTVPAVIRDTFSLVALYPLWLSYMCFQHAQILMGRLSQQPLSLLEKKWNRIAVLDPAQPDYAPLSGFVCPCCSLNQDRFLLAGCANCGARVDATGDSPKIRFIKSPLGAVIDLHAESDLVDEPWAVLPDGADPALEYLPGAPGYFDRPRRFGTSTKVIAGMGLSASVALMGVSGVFDGSGLGAVDRGWPSMLALVLGGLMLPVTGWWALSRSSEDTEHVLLWEPTGAAKKLAWRLNRSRDPARNPYFHPAFTAER